MSVVGLKMIKTNSVLYFRAPLLSSLFFFSKNDFRDSATLIPSFSAFSIFYHFQTSKMRTPPTRRFTFWCLLFTISLVKRGLSAGRGDDLEKGASHHHEEEQSQHDRADGVAFPGFHPGGFNWLVPLLDAVFIVFVGHSRPSCVAHCVGGKKELLPKKEIRNYECIAWLPK